MSASLGKQEPGGSHPPERGPCLPHEGGKHTSFARTDTLLGRGSILPIGGDRLPADACTDCAPA